MTNVLFLVLSFEGPDPYSHAGGLGTRVGEVSRALAELGFETHLFFVGDPYLPAHETREFGRLHLHRWCQWISHYHPAGVYDGEEGKRLDWERSLPAWLEAELLGPKIAAGYSFVVIGEEWQTVGSIVALHQAVARHGWQDRVQLLWNANNTFSFHRIDWKGLKQAANVTTVSRYMKQVMRGLGVDARIIPNGIPQSWLEPLDRRGSRALSGLFRGRLALAKVARWDPDKRWTMAVDAVAEMKRLRLRPLFLARGGLEEHGREVLARAEQQGLQVTSVCWTGQDVEALAAALRPAVAADMLHLQGYLSAAQRRALFHAADAVLANSGMEPFGLVGLETMAVGGVAFVGCTGEDYATPGHDAVSLQTDDPREIVHHLLHLRCSKEAIRRLRQAARLSAARYTWRAVIERLLLPLLEQLGIEFELAPPQPDASPLEAAQLFTAAAKAEYPLPALQTAGVRWPAPWSEAEMEASNAVQREAGSLPA